MLEAFYIFTRAGVVLFSLCWSTLRGDPISALVREGILPQRVRPDAAFETAEYSIRWAQDNKRDLLYAAVVARQMAGQVKYLDTLLEEVKTVFPAEHGAKLGALGDGAAETGSPAAMTADLYDLFGFQRKFQSILNAVELAAGGGGKKGGKQQQRMQQHAAAAHISAPDAPQESREGGAAGEEQEEEEDEFAEDMAVLEKVQNMRKAMLTKSSSGKQGPAAESGGSSIGGASTPSGAGKAGAGGKPGSTGKPKEMAQSLKQTYSKELEKKLDRSAGSPAAAGGAKGTPGKGAAGGAGGSGPEIEKVVFAHDSSTGRDFDDSDEGYKLQTSKAGAGGGAAAAAGVAGWLGKTRLGSFFSTLAGTKVLETADLVPLGEGLKNSLVSKNVAKEVADRLCDAVLGSLEGKKLEAMGSITATVQEALREACSRILTPRQSIDLLTEVRAKKAAGGGPYIIVFVGVNGVGKSTTLSKIAYHLKDNFQSVLIAACDSFRSGAVEQLKRHCTALDVPLFQQGYDRDPAIIASNAVKEAADKGIDVVLVDTAGRMQNNAPLMKQLATLVAMNKPDLVLFVGEALVGNDGVDQLCEFDKALVNHAVDSRNPRRIDGIVLTKFDTIDDKVGAALSMVYKTGIPVLFLGTGQTYRDLRRLNVGAVVKALMQA